MPCGSPDIPRILTGNEKASKASKSCKLCGQQELYWGIQGCANLCFPRLSVRQQNYCQHEKCQNQSFFIAVPFSPRHRVAILKTHPFGFSVYTKQKHLEMKSRISLLWEKERYSGTVGGNTGQDPWELMKKLSQYPPTAQEGAQISEMHCYQAD